LRSGMAGPDDHHIRCAHFSDPLVHRPNSTKALAGQPLRPLINVMYL
jgi:hypothetical protein